MATKAICFNCHFVAIGLADVKCPVCAYPLIKNTQAVALEANDLETLFERAATGSGNAPLLPGVNPEPRAAQLLIERRRQRADKLLQTRKRAAARAARRRIVSRAFAASAFLAGLFGALGVMAAL